MSDRVLRSITAFGLVASLLAIVVGAAIVILGIWGFIDMEKPNFSRSLYTDGVVFVAAVLINMAVSCYKRPGEC